MARSKRKSEVLDKATMRITGMKTIGEPLDFGNGLNLEAYETRFQALQNQLIVYNEMLNSIDGVATQIESMEQELRGYSERMLTGVLARYGKESSQYRQAGGKPRKAPSKRSIGTPPPTAPTNTPIETGMTAPPIPTTTPIETGMTAPSTATTPSMAAMN
jgi:hypothetical protein